MTKDIKEKINKVNEEFYKTISSSFDKTRRSSWDAWKNILEDIKSCAGFKKIRVLDLGCGNGRFAEFLVNNLEENVKIEYIGIDSSKELLDLGREKLQGLHDAGFPEKFNFKFLEQSFIKDNNTVGLRCLEKKFDLVVLFGVMHHIYDENSKIELFKQIKNLLNKDGKFIFTTWQFLNNQRQQKKILDLNSKEGEKFLEKFELEKKDIKKDDYILSWQMGNTAYRYCHHYSESEIKKIVKQTNFKISRSFFGDGKEGNLNQYFVLRE